MGINVVILAAGMGTRLSRPLPKPLTVLSDGRSILGQQIENLSRAFGEGFRLTIVVGFKLEAIIESFPHATYVYNELFDQTNTAKSLLKALRNSADGGVLWMNGDVVFDPRILAQVSGLIDADESFVLVNHARVAEEEVKYTLDSSGNIANLSKLVTDGLGEAIGINFISGPDKAKLITRLEEVSDQDYFERGLELLIQHDQAVIKAVDIADLLAIEIDTNEDLILANSYLS